MGTSVTVQVGYGIVLRGEEIDRFYASQVVDSPEDSEELNELGTYPHLRFDEPYDWTGSDTYLLIRTRSSAKDIRMFEGDRMLPDRCDGTSTPEELEELREIQERYSPEQELGMLVEVDLYR